MQSFKRVFTALLQGIIIIVHTCTDFCEPWEEDENKGDSILSLCFIIQLGMWTGFWATTQPRIFKIFVGELRKATLVPNKGPSIGN